MVRFNIVIISIRRTVVQMVEHYATGREVTGSIPGGVIGNFKVT